MSERVTPGQRREAKQEAQDFILRELRFKAPGGFQGYSDSQLWQAILDSERDGLALHTAVALTLFDHVMAGRVPPECPHFDHEIDTPGGLSS